ncbi:peptidase S8 [Paenibacillaceae bacterium]|nr:peptidase S8 [Paenibacillaceae bacterium]
MINRKYSASFRKLKQRTRAAFSREAPSFRCLVLLLLFCLFILPLQNMQAAGMVHGKVNPDGQVSPLTESSDPDEPRSWLLKWRDPAAAVALPDTEVLKRQPAAAVEVIRPVEGADTEQWLKRLSGLPEVEYVQQNGRVQVLTANVKPSVKVRPNDPELSKQSYLEQIGAKRAWEKITPETDMKIALVDTGIDLKHPDLKDNLVEGTNLVRPGRSPQDDNGHGTNVAGVIAAAGNNGEGVAGILWKAKLMPVKALDSDGFGDEDQLGEGVLYAVKHGAKIVVLAVGLYRESPYMRDIVKYAESNGVLLVAATGNDGEKYGSKIAVKYPAGYPTVLAVAGASSDNKPVKRSNSGSEVDIAAAWTVYTTKLGGGYGREEGTSMAAPQAAAAAALVWLKYPSLKPFQIREILRQSAKDIGPKGWDEATGYGLLQIDAALTDKYSADANEPNNTRAASTVFPLNSRIAGQLAGGADKDWFVLDVPYDGMLSIHFQGLVSPGSPMPPVMLTHYTATKKHSAIGVKIGSKTIEWPVSKGKNYIELRLNDQKYEGLLPYLLTAEFTIAPDDFEPNDKISQASTLAPRSQTITGNFHQTGDQDWFVMTFTQGGILNVEMSTDSVRIDPAFAIGRAGEPMKEVDAGRESETEKSQPITITPGKYYIRAYNAVSGKASPVMAEYKLKFDFLMVYDDPNEPNDKLYEATSMRLGGDYVGVINKADDVDWFQIRLNNESIVNMKLDDVPKDRKMKLEVYDKKQKLLFDIAAAKGHTTATTNRKLAAGVYYIKLTSDKPFTDQYYHFSVHADPIIAGFRDIQGHWAQNAIAGMADKKLISGYGEYRFAPDRPITRAEAVSILTKAFGSKASNSSPKLSFNDVKASHWARNAIASAVSQEWVKGYPDGKFAPDRPITRAEMATMFGAANEVKGIASVTAPFIDVKADNWAAPMLHGLKKTGWIGGYPDNSFKPNRNASRAEFAALVFRAIY